MLVTDLGNVWCMLILSSMGKGVVFLRLNLFGSVDLLEVFVPAQIRNCWWWPVLLVVVVGVDH